MQVCSQFGTMRIYSLEDQTSMSLPSDNFCLLNSYWSISQDLLTCWCQNIHNLMWSSNCWLKWPCLVRGWRVGMWLVLVLLQEIGLLTQLWPQSLGYSMWSSSLQSGALAIAWVLLASWASCSWNGLWGSKQSSKLNTHMLQRQISVLSTQTKL